MRVYTLRSDRVPGGVFNFGMLMSAVVMDCEIDIQMIGYAGFDVAGH